ncbi:hypothetical protein [uncultured Bartonella sp.]|uniref:hypothetical protein n=1 Tax=uncultured Bartonella sp. TaxID=104108 RepID=UPI002639F44E|nr:hypothetical protein [uncultured Bartonella sp.]
MARSYGSATTAEVDKGVLRFSLTTFLMAGKDLLLAGLVDMLLSDTNDVQFEHGKRCFAHSNSLWCVARLP